MRLSQMTYFLTIADTGSFSGAAEILYVSQPALSKQITLLEQEIGTPLLIRKARGVSLTDAGVQFAADCRRILSKLNEAVHKAAEIGNQGAHQLRIGCFDGAYIDDFILPLYQHVRQYYPNINIKLLRQTIGENRKIFKSGEIDLLIEPYAGTVLEASADDPLSMKILTHRKGAFIYSENSILASKQSLSISDFINEPILIAESKDNQALYGRVMDSLQAFGFSNPQIERFDNIISLMSMLRLGHGFAFLTKDIAENIPGLKAYDLPDEYGLDIIAVWRKKNTLAASVMNSYS